MKTLTITPGTRTLNLDDIIFEGRNQEYGAYNLRQQYNKHLIWSLITATGIAFSIVVSAYITANRHPAPITIDLRSDYVIDPTLVDPIEPPPPIPNIPSIPITGIFTVPRVVENPTTETTLPLPDDPIDNAGNADDPTNLTATTIITPTIPDEEPPVLRPDVPAQFQGGDLETFRNWVTQNLNYPKEAIDLALEGKVTLQFVVNKKGIVEKIKVLRGIDKLLDEEAARVIMSSPVWIPGMVKGKIVSQAFVLPITFKMQK